MAYVRAFALLGSDGKKIKAPGCATVKLPHGSEHGPDGGEVHAGEVRFGPNTGEAPWPAAVSLVALDKHFDELGAVTLAEPVAVGPDQHLIVGFTLEGAFAVTGTKLEVDDCHVARGKKPEAPDAGGPAHTIHIHDKAKPRDELARKGS